MIYKFAISTTQKFELFDITDQIINFVKKSKVKNGVCIIQVPHATAALIMNENESGLKKDIMRTLNKLVPKNLDYLHDRIDNNAQAHILSSIIGTNKTLVIENSEFLRGTWQQIFFVELDGPRSSRNIITKIIKS